MKDNRYKIDPRNAAVRPWDFKLCLDCGALIPQRCPVCYGNQFTEKPGQIIGAGLKKFGLPPETKQA